jgi:hypothetical protein
MEQNHMFAILIMNGVGLFLGILCGVLSYRHQRKISKRKGLIWGFGCFFGWWLLFIAIIGIAEFEDESRKKSAFEDLEKSYENRGDKKHESYKNLELVLVTSSTKHSTYQYMYVANFNKKVTYKGKINISLIKNDKTVSKYTTGTITIKPGEKKEVKNDIDTNYFDSYSWHWDGELK